MAPVTSSQQQVLDALYSKLSNLTYPTLNSNHPTVYVYDGYPNSGTSQVDNFITIAGTSTAAASGQETWAAIGNLARYERYNVDIHIWCWVGGNNRSGSTGLSDAQQTARDNAASILATIETAILEDANLALENNNEPLVIWCLIESVTLTQTSEEDANAMGRYANYALKLNVYNRLEG